MSAVVPWSPEGGGSAAGGGAGSVTGRTARRRRHQRQDPLPVLPSQQRGPTMARHWPLHSYLELGALPGAVPCARLHARQMLWEWRLTDIGDSAELIVSELVTNGIKANRAVEEAPPIRFWMLSDR